MTARTEYSIALGKRLRAVRNGLRLSLREVEEKSAGRWKSSVAGSYERGTRSVTAAQLTALCEFYGADPRDLIADGPPLVTRAVTAAASASALLERAAIADTARNLQAVYVKDGATWPFADLIEEAR